MSTTTHCYHKNQQTGENRRWAARCAVSICAVSRGPLSPTGPDQRLFLIIRGRGSGITFLEGHRAGRSSSRRGRGGPGHEPVSQAPAAGRRNALTSGELFFVLFPEGCLGELEHTIDWADTNNIGKRVAQRRKKERRAKGEQQRARWQWQDQAVAGTRRR